MIAAAIARAIAVLLAIAFGPVFSSTSTAGLSRNSTSCRQARPVSARCITQEKVVEYAKLCFLDAPVFRVRVETFDRIKDALLNLSSEVLISNEIDVILRSTPHTI
jgi:hypothetical protein